MAIKELIIENFKGLKSEKRFDIAPITLFVGANSSGKSSTIHSLAALSQTVKLGDRNRPIILDDENALVHLGRFIEVIHTKSYKDSIHIGINLGALQKDISIHYADDQIDVLAAKGSSIIVQYWFKSTLKTQEVQLQKAIFQIGDDTYQFKPIDQIEFEIERNGKKLEAVARRGNGFNITVSPNPQQGVDSLNAFFVIEEVQRMQNAELRKCAYLGPFREPPRRKYQNFGSFPKEAGALGENSITLLANEHVKSKNRPHLAQVGEWLRHMGLAKAVNVKRIGTSDLFDVSLTLTDEKQLPIADLGYGLSQVLPVLVQCSFAEQNSTLLFEQPELHLHQGAAKKLAKVFIDTYKQKNAHMIIETHSKELIHELMSYIKINAIKPEDVALYDVVRENTESVFKRATISLEDGSVEVDHPWFKSLG